MKVSFYTIKGVVLLINNYPLKNLVILNFKTTLYIFN
jgi:hypothetical protein